MDISNVIYSITILYIKFFLINNKSIKMKIKTIFKINIALIFLQGLPLFITWFSNEFKMILLADVFGNNPSKDVIMMFDQFALVLGLVIIGIIALIYGSLSFNDMNVLRRLSLLYFVLAGFFALPDLLSALKGEPTAPLPVIILGLISMGLFYYGSKKGSI